jgi:adenylylsulfate kinase-like enzyme
MTGVDAPYEAPATPDVRLTGEGDLAQVLAD